MISEANVVLFFIQSIMSELFFFKKNDVKYNGLFLINIYISAGYSRNIDLFISSVSVDFKFKFHDSINNILSFECII